MARFSRSEAGRKRWQTEPLYVRPVLSDTQRRVLMERWREDLRNMDIDRPSVEVIAPTRGMSPQQWNRWIFESCQVDADKFRARVMRRCRYFCHMKLTDIANVFSAELLEVCKAVHQ